MRLFFSVGEPSGDLHGSNLIRELRVLHPEVECAGYGGPLMAAAGCDLHEDLTQLAVMFLAQVFRNLKTFRQLLQRADDYFRTQRPDAVILIDYPGFNFHIARKAKKYGIPVFYYGAPQMWAWASWRIGKMRRLTDHVLCKLPFEADWYRKRGCNAHYIGHPYFDQLERQTLDKQFLDDYGNQPGSLVLILPGSRNEEVRNNLRWFLKAARIIHRTVPEARFAIASYNDKQAEMTRSHAAESGLPVDVFVGRTQELMHLCHCCMACSGSVSLELLHHAKPTVVLYWLNTLMYNLVGRWLLKVKYITLVNLLACADPFTDRMQEFNPRSPGADEVPFPEYATFKDKSKPIAAHVIEWLTDSAKRDKKIAQLQQIKADFGPANASHRAAEYILQNLNSTAKNEEPARAA